MNVLACRQIHDSITTPVSGPQHLLHFLFNRRGNRRVPDIRIDLDQEIAPYNHRLAFRMIDISRDNSPTGGYLRAHKLRLDLFTDSNKLHLRCDNTTPSIVQLRHSMATLSTKRLMSEFAGDLLGI